MSTKTAKALRKELGYKSPNKAAQGYLKHNNHAQLIVDPKSPRGIYRAAKKLV
jgi:hypothetical protein